MKELNELKAEIFRRSEEKIKERQRRRRKIVAVCVPLCLCAVLVSALSLPRFFQEKNLAADKLELSADVAEMSGGSEPDAIVGNGFADSEIAVAELQSQVGGTEQYAKITDKERASELYGMIMRMFRTTGTSGEPEGNPEAQENFETSYSIISPSSPTAEYTVTFTGEDGKKAVFYIDGDTVTDMNGVSAKLSPEELESLKTALGLSEQ